jgi:hypothetical protein
MGYGVCWVGFWDVCRMWVLALNDRASEGLSTRIVLLSDPWVDLREQVLGERAQKFPGQIQGLENGPVLVPPLGDKLPFEFLDEFDEQMVLLCERFLAYYGLHGHDVFASGVGGVELVGHSSMVLYRV